MSAITTKPLMLDFGQLQGLGVALPRLDNLMYRAFPSAVVADPRTNDFDRENIPERRALLQSTNELVSLRNKLVSIMVQSKQRVHDNEGTQPLVSIVSAGCASVIVSQGSPIELVDIIEPLKDKWTDSLFQARRLAKIASENTNADY